MIWGEKKQMSFFGLKKNLDNNNHIVCTYVVGELKEIPKSSCYSNVSFHNRLETFYVIEGYTNQL